ncbi:hypothetical protein [Chondromyces crocatus]|uniref:Outer membrane protein beta-barrel domain-containing protein n=1 Tax=Chondromyces crocatus TaxID=52 RepID=A0A0K1E8B7_CHOCO|nr:hypothetical protein [Chondromyces crocatus]AKT37095.1 uncharacterized protein CMC5_012210 [Chondromyces crocatus]
MHRQSPLRIGLVLGATLCFASAASAQEEQPITLELGGRLGVAARADQPPDFTLVDPAGLDLEVAAYIAPRPAFSLGLAFQHLGLGRERSAASSFGLFEVSRDVQALWAALRLNLDFADRAGLGLELGPGLAWQGLDASGFLGLTDRPTRFTCSAGGSANLGLRVGASGWVSAGAGFALTAGVGAEALQLSSDVLDGCASGAGSTLMLGIRLGIAYRVDVRPAVHGGGATTPTRVTSSGSSALPR